jgi:uncharacterized protein YdbL (DUF1318 family)
MRTLNAFFLTLLILIMNAPGLLAATYDIKEMTPAIESALQNRQARYGHIQEMKEGGILGEDSRGYVAVLKPFPDADSVASAENADRRTIYEAIVSQNNLGGEGLAQVEAAFAAVQREKARSGDSIQLPSGDWTKK